MPGYQRSNTFMVKNCPGNPLNTIKKSSFQADF
jgi:hypothetical protein